jgi:homocysteine S-methyltransferase
VTKVTKRKSNAPDLTDRDPLAPFLRQQGFFVLDGGLATELERHGIDLADPLWSARALIDAPQTIRRVHLEYFAAGADVATSASYQATFEGFALRGIGESSAASLMRLSVELAVAARDEFWSIASNRDGRLRPLVAASIGPYGAALADGSEYRGDYGLARAELATFHRTRMSVLADTNADLLAFETIPCRLEAEVLIELLAEFPRKRAWLSFSCRDSTRVSHGEPFAACVALTAQSEQIVAVGLNCTAPSLVVPLLRSAAATPRPLLAYPNSGEVWDAGTRAWKPGAVDSGSNFPARRWHSAGARLIGGCCRTTPGDVRRIRSALTA